MKTAGKDEGLGMGMDLKVMAFDIDGTLTNDLKVITGDTKEALLAVQEHGVRLVLASARPVPGLYGAARVLQMERYQGIDFTAFSYQRK